MSKWRRIAHEWPEAPNTNLISRSCILSQVGNEIFIIFKHRVVRPASATKKLVLHQYRPGLFENRFNQGELFWRRNLLAVARPLVSFGSAPWPEFHLGHIVRSIVS